MRLGVFAQGQLWALSIDGKFRLAFIARSEALAAALAEARSAQRWGLVCELWVQDETGFVSQIDIERPEIWLDALMVRSLDSPT